jgi:hypothetical protein
MRTTRTISNSFTNTYSEDDVYRALTVQIHIVAEIGCETIDVLSHGSHRRRMYYLCTLYYQDRRSFTSAAAAEHQTPLTIFKYAQSSYSRSVLGVLPDEHFCSQLQVLRRHI